MEQPESALERVRRDLGLLLPRNDSNATITVNAGNLGVWLCLTACIVVIAVSLVGAQFVVREFVRYDQQLQELREKDDIHDAWIQTINNRKKESQ